jgi:hypothetical protein
MSIFQENVVYLEIYLVFLKFWFDSVACGTNDSTLVWSGLLQPGAGDHPKTISSRHHVYLTQPLEEVGWK